MICMTLMQGFGVILIAVIRNCLGLLWDHSGMMSAGLTKHYLANFLHI